MAKKHGQDSGRYAEDKATFVFRSAEARRATSSALMRKSRSESLSRARKAAGSHGRSKER